MAHLLVGRSSRGLRGRMKNRLSVKRIFKIASRKRESVVMRRSRQDSRQDLERTTVPVCIIRPSRCGILNLKFTALAFLQLQGKVHHHCGPWWICSTIPYSIQYLQQIEVMATATIDIDLTEYAGLLLHYPRM